MATDVVLVHGLARTSLSMAYLAKFLRDHGYKTHNFGYPSRKQDITSHAIELDEFLEKRITPGTPLHFVTHSLGSLVLRKYLSSHGDRYIYKNAVMLGPPNQGSQFARAVRPVYPVAKFLGPAFLEICDLELENSSDKIHIGIIAGGTTGKIGLSPLIRGDNDGVVRVSETELEGSHETLIVRGLHSFLMYYPSVLKQITCFLEKGNFEK